MLRHLQHPSGSTLLQAIDDELPPARRTTVERHLSGCERCRTRLQHMESIAAEVSRLYRDERMSSGLSTDALRTRVRAGIQDLSETLDRSWRFQLLEGLTAVPAPAWAGAVLVLTVFLTRALVPTPAPFRSDVVPTSIESGALPLRSLTPGVAGRTPINALCAVQNRAAARPRIPAVVRSAVLRDYGMEAVPEREYELDYLITPELGGIADRGNLWPERYGSPVWNAHVKDQLERLLAEQVCAGRLDLATAQQDIAANWIAAYKKYFQTDGPIASQARVLVDDVDDDDAPLVVSMLAPPGSKTTSPW
jgi:hypothetical protein